MVNCDHADLSKDSLGFQAPEVEVHVFSILFLWRNATISAFLMSGTPINITPMSGALWFSVKLLGWSELEGDLWKPVGVLVESL